MVWTRMPPGPMSTVWLLDQVPGPPVQVAPELDRGAPVPAPFARHSHIGEYGGQWSSTNPIRATANCCRMIPSRRRRAAADRLDVDVGPERRGQPGALQLLQRRLRPAADGDVLQRRAEGLGGVREPDGEFVWNLATYGLRQQMNRPRRRFRAARARSRSPGSRWRRRGWSGRRAWPPRRRARMPRDAAGRHRARPAAWRAARPGGRRAHRRALHRRRAGRHRRDAADRPLRLSRRLRGRHRTVGTSGSPGESGSLADEPPVLLG